MNIIEMPEWMTSKYYVKGSSWNEKMLPGASKKLKDAFEKYHNRAFSYKMRKEQAPQLINPYYRWDGTFEEDKRCVSGIRERDIDLVIARAFYEESCFFDMLIRKCNLSGLFDKTNIVSVNNSEYEFGKESDLLIEFKVGEFKFRIRIEDKIDAPFQKNQLEEYLKRAANDLNNGYRGSKVVLLAPQKYLNSVKDYDEIIRFSYEELFECLMYEDGFSAMLVMSAINKPKKTVDQQVTEFWNDYVAAYNRCADKVEDAIYYKGIPGAKGRNATWFTFKTGIKGAKIIHKADDGKIVLELNKKYYDIKGFDIDRKKEGVILLDGKKTFAIGINVPKMNPNESFACSDDEMTLLCKRVRQLMRYIKD